MRRLSSMKNKRRRTEESNNKESKMEENGSTPRSTQNDDEPLNKSHESKRSNPKARSSASKRKISFNDDADTRNDSVEDIRGNDEQENNEVEKSNAVKKRSMKDTQIASTSSQNKSTDDEDEYEVERIISQRTIKGRRQFLIRWKDYGEANDSWENEKDLNCPKLIEDFLADEEEAKEPVPMSKNSKSLKVKTKKSKKSKSNHEKADESGTEIPSKEYEVEKILDVYFKKNQSREFLIRWKGFNASSDTWEPEKNLNCPELITKFMQKVEKAKTAELRELRTNPTHTKRYTLTTPDSGRRLSRRNIDKQRATYHEWD